MRPTPQNITMVFRVSTSTRVPDARESALTMAAICSLHSLCYTSSRRTLHDCSYGPLTPRGCMGALRKNGHSCEIARRCSRRHGADIHCDQQQNCKSRIAEYDCDIVTSDFVFGGFKLGSLRDFHCLSPWVQRRSCAVLKNTFGLSWRM